MIEKGFDHDSVMLQLAHKRLCFVSNIRFGPRIDPSVYIQLQGMIEVFIRV